jgi:phospho-N-acetylmuramoyl-pentapeptide-transferase
MLLILIEYLRAHFGLHIPAAFSYTSTRAICATATALACTLLFGGRFIKKLYELKIGQPIRELKGFLLSELHRNKKDTPTMGGSLILFALMVSLLIWMDLSSPFTWILAGTIIAYGCIGGWDDYLKLRHNNHHGLSAKKKLLFQLLWASLVILYLEVPGISSFFESFLGLKVPIVKEYAKGVGRVLPLQEYISRLYVPFFKEPLLIFSGIGLLFLALFFAIVIVGSSNAVNLTDGLDGLASGLIIFVCAVFGILAFASNHVEIAEYLNILYVSGSGEIAIFMAACGGAALGFLWYNSFPAEVFMGDIGSLSLGGVLGVSAILLRREFLLAIVGALFVAEALSVLLQVIGFRYFGKKRLFLCAPLHHHFEYLGWPEAKVVIRFWIIGFLLSLIGLASIKFQ